MPTLKAATARANLTPYVGVCLSGFGGRDHGAEGIHDELWAKALVLEAGDTRVALVSCDLIGLTLESVAGIRQRTEAMCGLPGDHVVLAATHTHSGPAMGCLRLLGQDPAWVEVVEKKIAGAITEASRNLADAKFGVGCGDVQIGINRRERQSDGTIRLGRNPGGPVDTTVGVLRVDSASGAPIAALIHHPCHPVVLGGNNYLISADFPGSATAFVERALPGVTALFVNGCAGNINSDPVGHTFEAAERLGATLGAEAVKTYHGIELAAEMTLRAATEWAEAPLQPLPPREETQSLFDSRQQALDAEVATGKLSPLKRDTDHVLGWLKDVLAEWDKPQQQTTRRLEVQAVAIGDAAFVTTPGETFVEIGQAIAAGSPSPHTFVTGYTNGVIGYIPVDTAFDEGGYEVDSAYKFYYGTYSLAPGTEGAVVSAGIRAAEAVA
jgi:hypothetical protein